jgi:hypothetical protein
VFVAVVQDLLDGCLSLLSKALYTCPHLAYLFNSFDSQIDMAARTATISRNTNETQIEVSIDLDCAPGSANAQVIEISTGIGFLDHVRMVDSLTLDLAESLSLPDVPCLGKAWRNVAHYEM